MYIEIYIKYHLRTLSIYGWHTSCIFANCFLVVSYQCWPNHWWKSLIWANGWVWWWSLTYRICLLKKSEPTNQSLKSKNCTLCVCVCCLQEFMEQCQCDTLNCSDGCVPRDLWKARTVEPFPSSGSPLLRFFPEIRPLVVERRVIRQPFPVRPYWITS